MPIGPEDVFARIEALPGAAFVDSGTHDGWSILAWDPVRIETAGEFVDLGRAMSAPVGLQADAPWNGGCIGYIGYPDPARRPSAEPPLWLARYEGGLCFHPQRGFVAVGSAGFRRDAERLLARTIPLGSARTAPPPVSVTTVDRDEHERRIRRILELITDGDCYQVNLTRAVHLETDADALSCWLRVRRLADPRYGVFLRLGELSILSASPELLLDADGRRVRSLPIKGTRPRSPDPVVDRAHRMELVLSEKDKAELVMIVDLVRNDLGRVAATGSVAWEARRIEPLPNVWHASQGVSATLADGFDLWDALAALFPAGSITGAPKIRACQRIAELEHEPRGVYCGTAGFASGERAVFNVAIRTAVHSPGRIRYHVGGGIVADSDPLAEWEETVAKGTAMARAFAGTPDPEGRSDVPRKPTSPDRRV